MTPEQIDHINAIIEAIKTEKIAYFDMPAWIDYKRCGTYACIGGFSDLLLGIKFTEYTPDYDAVVAERFGLSKQDFTNMIYSLDESIPLHAITKDMAVRALESVRDTGKFTTWSDYA